MNWKDELNNNITTVEELQVKLQYNLSLDVVEKLKRLIELYPMSVTHYYLSLINPSNEHDPIKKMCIPSVDEINLSGSFDTSGEITNTVTIGLQHKYKQTALLLSTNQCAMYCRYCFRKRLVGISENEISKHFLEMVSYIKEHKEISNVLITGGDAFLNDNKRIQAYLEAFVSIDHLDFVRFGTRTPVVLPSRIYDDKELLAILKAYNLRKKIYVVTHFNHPNELTKESKKAIDCLLECGITIKNQTVLLKGINDNGKILTELINKLTSFGVVPYYVFQCRPVASVKSQFQVPIKKGYKIIQEAKAFLNGQGKCFRYVLSNERGKIEIIGELPDGSMLFKYHQAKHPEDQGRIYSLNISDNQCWI
jgi:lysine 2,3-aminomutase